MGADLHKPDPTKTTESGSDLDKQVEYLSNKVGRTSDSILKSNATKVEKEKQDFVKHDAHFRLQKFEWYEQREQKQSQHNEDIRSRYRNEESVFDDDGGSGLSDSDLSTSASNIGNTVSIKDLGRRQSDRRKTADRFKTEPTIGSIRSDSIADGSFTRHAGKASSQVAEKVVQKQMFMFASSSGVSSSDHISPGELWATCPPTLSSWSLPTKVPKAILSPDGTQAGVLLGLHD
jgi:hypothetical protein